LHFDWEKMTYEVVQEDQVWPAVSEERIEEWWQLSRGPIDRESETSVALKHAFDELEVARAKAGGAGFTAREMRMLEEIERLRKVLDPSRDRPGWGSRAWQPRPGEVGADGTRH
jgi:hypothetical protein